MAIKSKTVLDFKGMQVSVDGSYSRFKKAEIDTVEGTKLVFLDFKDQASAQPKLDTKKRVLTPDFDPNNPEHVEKWEAAGSPDPNELDAHGNGWKPTFYEDYQEWDGRSYVGEILQTREILLSTELAMAFAAKALQGDLPKTPTDAIDALKAQAYLAALASGEFTDPVTV